MKNNKVRLYVSDVVKDVAISFPAYYTISPYLAKNEAFLDALQALHSVDFSHYQEPKEFEELFNALKSGYFAIYKEKYIIGLFGGRLMYLESNGWKSLTPTEDIFKVENYLVC